MYVQENSFVQMLILRRPVAVSILLILAFPAMLRLSRLVRRKLLHWQAMKVSQRS